MSFGVTLKADSNTVTVEHVTGTVPDGVFLVSGHVDHEREELAVSRTDPDGKPAGHVSHSVPRRPHTR